MKNSSEKDNIESSETAKKRAHEKKRIKSSRRPGEYKSKSKVELIEEHKNPIIRFLSKTGYTIWLVVLGIGMVLAFVVSVALL